MKNVILTQTDGKFLVFVVNSDGSVNITADIEKYLKSGEELVYMNFDDFLAKYITTNKVKTHNIKLNENSMKYFDKYQYILNHSSKIGNIKYINNDSCITTIHKKNSNIKLLAVADGVDSLSNASDASKIVINSLKNWFNNLNPKLPADEVCKKMLEEIDNINTKLINNAFNATMGSTLSGVVILENETIYANIGDSRIYLFNNKINQLTEDDNDSWSLYKGDMISKEDIGLVEVNQSLNMYLGMPTEKIKVKSGIIDNNTYKGILLFTDGVTDLLSDSVIENIIRITDRKLIADKITQTAVEKDQKKGLEPGKDNATAAVYIKS